MDKPKTACSECGMLIDPGEYHPIGACMIYKACNNPATVEACLDAIMMHGAARYVQYMKHSLEAGKHAIH